VRVSISIVKHGNIVKGNDKQEVKQVAGSKIESSVGTLNSFVIHRQSGYTVHAFEWLGQLFPRHCCWTMGILSIVRSGMWIRFGNDSVCRPC